MSTSLLWWQPWWRPLRAVLCSQLPEGTLHVGARVGGTNTKRSVDVALFAAPFCHDAVLTPTDWVLRSCDVLCYVAKAANTLK